MKSRVDVWTCDRCDHIERTPAGNQPEGWACFALNRTSADAAWDHPDWHRAQLCSVCTPVIVDSVHWPEKS